MSKFRKNVLSVRKNRLTQSGQLSLEAAGLSTILWKKDVPDSAGLSPLVAGTALIFHHLMFFPLFFIINYTICVCRDVFSYYIS